MDASKSQAQRALSVLREMVVTNQLPPGSTHLEVELAEMLGMSRTPVREAAIILESRGLVEMRPRRGMRVLPVNVDDLREIYDILAALEPLAAQRLAERGLSDEEYQALDAEITGMERALAAEDREAWARHDELFHRHLVTFAGNRRVIEFTQNIEDQVQRARMMTLHLRPPPYDSNSDHRALLEAIRDKNTEEARVIHSQHRARAGEMMVELIQKHGLGPV
ncbi:MAG: GntR family transcriptional regulator [Pseudomonadota bacterium]